MPSPVAELETDLISGEGCSKARAQGWANHPGLALRADLSTNLSQGFSDMSDGITHKQIGKFTIESGVPIPPKSGGRAKIGVAAAIHALAVGDSMLLVGINRSNACTMAERMGYRVITRKTEDGIRMWRIEGEAGIELVAKRVERKVGKTVERKAVAAPPAPVLPPLPAPPPAGSTAPLEPLEAAAICKEAGVNVARFNPLLLEWRERGVTEQRLREALNLGARSTKALDEVFRA